MRIFVVLGLCAVLGGCGLIARKEREDQISAAKASMEEGFAACKTQYPEGSKQYVAKNVCDAAAAQSMRPFVPYPDLFDQNWANRAVIAERLQAGKMTVAEANQQATQMQSQITAEEQRRSLSGRVVNAQESQAAAAWRASSPVSCTRIGNTTNCY